MTNVLQSETLSVESRIHLLEIAYQILKILKNETKHYLESPTKNSKCKKARYLTNIQLVRINNTILALAYALKYHSKGIALSRIGIHLVEFVFARMRRMAYHKNDSQTLTDAVVRAELCQKVLKRYNIRNTSRGRIDFAGARHNPEAWIIDMHTEYPTDKICEDMQKILQGENDFPTISSFVNSLCKKSPSPPIHLYSELNGVHPHIRNTVFSRNTK